MSFYSNGERIDLATVRPYDSNNRPREYTGDDPIRRVLYEGWAWVWNRFLKKGKEVLLITPKIKSGLKPGSDGYFVPRALPQVTRFGTFDVIWCDTMFERDGTTTYLPTHYNVERRKKVLGERDIEEILFNVCFNPYFKREATVAEIKNMPHEDRYNTYLQDDEEIASGELADRKKFAELYYYLAEDDISPIAGDEEALNRLCSWGGVSKPENKTWAVKCNELIKVVEMGEKNNDATCNCAAFSYAVRNLDGNKVQCLSIIQQSLDRGMIQFNKDQYRWELIGENKQAQKVLVKVAPVDVKNAKDILCKHLMNTPDDVSILQSGVGATPLKGNRDADLTVELPEKVTEEVLDGLSWPDVKRLYRRITKNTDFRNKSKAEMMPFIKEFFILNKKTLADLD